MREFKAYLPRNVAEARSTVLSCFRVKPMVTFLKIYVRFEAVGRAHEAEGGTVPAEATERENFPGQDRGFVRETMLIMAYFVNAGLWGGIPRLENLVIHSLIPHSKKSFYSSLRRTSYKNVELYNFDFKAAIWQGLAQN